MRIIFASAQMAWSNCWGAGCDYGLTQSEVEIWQPSSLFDLCRQLKESPSGFKVQKDVYTGSNKSGCYVRSALFFTEHQLPLFIVGSEAAGLSPHRGATEFHCCLQACPWPKVSWERFSPCPQPRCSLCPLSLGIML